ncbi:MAG: BON domain-containing protein [Elusimicrobia bacterium]|nr:BON domain-containing protein [Elusimicrobiota bacterium]
MRRFLLVLLAAWSLSASACRSAQVDEDLSDSATKARVEAVLRGRKDLDLTYVTVDVTMGVATLSGIVPSPEQLRVIRKLAATVRGVDQVLNNLVIQE